MGKMLMPATLINGVPAKTSSAVTDKDLRHLLYGQYGTRMSDLQGLLECGYWVF